MIARIRYEKTDFKTYIPLSENFGPKTACLPILSYLLGIYEAGNNKIRGFERRIFGD